MLAHSQVVPTSRPSGPIAVASDTKETSLW